MKGRNVVYVGPFIAREACEGESSVMAMSVKPTDRAKPVPRLGTMRSRGNDQNSIHGSHQGLRSTTAPTGRTHDRKCRHLHSREKTLASRGPSTHDGNGPLPPCVSLLGCWLPLVSTIPSPSDRDVVCSRDLNCEPRWLSGCKRPGLDRVQRLQSGEQRLGRNIGPTRIQAVGEFVVNLRVGQWA